VKFGALMAVVFALVLSGCGNGKKTASQPSQTSSTAPATPTATSPTSTTPTSSTPATTTGTPTEPPAAGGGEEPVRTPAVFVFGSGGRVSSPTVTVPAFIAVDVTLVSRDGRAHELALNAAGRRYRFRVAAGRVSTVRIPGLKAGTYPLSPVGGGPGARLVVGGEAGP
jgi:hypothetical protein